MKNVKVSQRFPNSKDNTITLKLVRESVPANGSLAGDYMVVKNEKTIARFRVESVETLEAMRSFYYQIEDSLQLTSINDVLVNLDNF